VDGAQAQGKNARGKRLLLIEETAAVDRGKRPLSLEKNSAPNSVFYMGRKQSAQ
jgi:hypothetical protein